MQIRLFFSFTLSKELIVIYILTILQPKRRETNLHSLFVEIMNGGKVSYREKNNQEDKKV